MSADPYIQAPFNSQSLNRYSYVWNSSLSLIDPSGFVPVCLPLKLLCYETDTGGFSSPLLQRLGEGGDTRSEYRRSLERFSWAGGLGQVASAAYRDPQGQDGSAQASRPQIGSIPASPHVNVAVGPGTEVYGYQERSLDSVTAAKHYRSGEGTPLRMSFDEIDTSSVRPSQFLLVQAELGRGPRDDTLSIDDRLLFSTSGDQALFLGDITLRLQGELVIRSSGTFNFAGTLKSFDDIYDFNRAKRGFFGESLTWIGRRTAGTPYWIEIRGVKPITESGRVP